MRVWRLPSLKSIAPPPCYERRCALPEPAFFFSVGACGRRAWLVLLLSMWRVGCSMVWGTVVRLPRSLRATPKASTPGRTSKRDSPMRRKRKFRRFGPGRPWPPPAKMKNERGEVKRSSRGLGVGRAPMRTRADWLGH